MQRLMTADELTAIGSALEHALSSSCPRTSRRNSAQSSS
jgi:hypothetical protein